eukprot:TRINITY_DN4533_c0_g2_i2.p1 TRINITY_DN4533_c0_g2~~TRINITY_DN4533_c0_g2_i2.p1  ORF type:complete len:835 (+),score=183.39 TRINITY_DN4533_c0_g2_i2:42-2546(+)
MSDNRDLATVQVPSKDPEKTDKEKADALKPVKQEDRKIDTDADMSEEDLKIKSDVQDCVDKIYDKDEGIQKLAITTLTNLLRTSTGSSVTSIPKPLKFCRAHYPKLVEHYNKMNATSENAKSLADVLALVSISMFSKKEGDETPSLSFKLKGHPSDLEAWGHEFLRFIAAEVGVMWNLRSAKAEEDGEEKPVNKDLQEIIDVIVPYYLKQASEPAACDLLTECDQLESIIGYCTKDNYEKITSYLTATSFYLPHPENKETVAIAFRVYHNLKVYPMAMLLALKLNNMDKVEQLMEECEDMNTKKQLAIMLGRQRVILETGDETIDNLIWNTKLSEFYLYTARDLDSMAPKAPADVYKTHLQDQRTHLTSEISSHQLNLASTFVNAFVNAGFECDTLLTPSTDSGNEWMYKNKESRMMSAAASLGLLYLWDVQEGMIKIDKYLYSSEDYIKSGTLIAMGILNCGVKDECDPALATMDDYLQNKSRDLRLGAIIGLGFAYAGSRRDVLRESLIPIVMDASEYIDVQAFAALSLGLIYVGSCNEDVSEALISCLVEKQEEKQASAPMCRFIALAAGLLFLGSEEGADAAIESSVAMHPSIQKFAEAVIKICAYAGTGNVVQIQALLEVISASSGKDPKPDPKDDKNKNKEAEKEKGITPEMVSALGIALVAIGEPLGTEMCKRMFDSVLQYGSGTSRRAVPLALAMANISSPLLSVVDTLSKLSHDPDSETSMNAIFALGIVAAGTNNARVASLLRNLASYYAKEANHLFLVRVAQGIVMLGKGHLTLSPIHSDRSLLSPVALGGLLVTMFAVMDVEVCYRPPFTAATTTFFSFSFS